MVLKLQESCQHAQDVGQGNATQPKTKRHTSQGCDATCHLTALCVTVHFACEEYSRILLAVDVKSITEYSWLGNCSQSVPERTNLGGVRGDAMDRAEQAAQQVRAILSAAEGKSAA